MGNEISPSDNAGEEHCGRTPGESAELDSINDNSDDWSPKDGYRIESFPGTATDERIALYLTLFANREVAMRKLLLEWHSPQPEQYGERDRWLAFFEGFAHFLNAGGNLWELLDVLGEFGDGLADGQILTARNADRFEVCEDSPLPEIEPLPEYELVSTELVQTHDGFRPRHIFANPQGAAICWLEDVYVDKTGLPGVEELLTDRELLDDP